jgi:hypothetical protein
MRDNLVIFLIFLFQTFHLVNVCIQVHVDSDLKVDPVFLDVLDQENRVHLELEPMIWYLQFEVAVTAMEPQ